LVTLACATFALSGAARAANRYPLLGTGSYSGPVKDGPRTLASSVNGLIVTVDPDSVSCQTSATFEDVEGGEPPGTNYDGVVWSGGIMFAERFLGQSVGYSGDYDVITGAPVNPLQPQEGAAGQNLDVFAYTSNVCTGLGPQGFPEIDAIGEGSIAACFTVSQSRVALDIVGGNGGDATLRFYRADGTLIDTITITGVGEFRYGFAMGDLSNSIAGFLIQTTDPSGVGIDNVCHEGTVVPTRALTWGSLKSKYR
jgi:hypothetical protein